MPRFNGNIEFIHSSGQVLAPTGDLTLRTDDLVEPRSIIIGSGASLRPERDAIQRLGTPDLRWYDAHIGNLLAESGTFSPAGGGFSCSFLVNGIGVFGGTTTWTSSDIEMTSNSAFTIEGASEFTSNGINKFTSTSQFEMDTLMEPSIDNLGTIGQTAKRFARLHATSGVFNLLESQASGTNIFVESSLMPNKEAIYSIGAPVVEGGEDSTGIRWASIVGASGRFNAIYPPISGIGVGGHPGEYIEIGGSLMPPTSQITPTPYWLGAGKFNRWQGVDAYSGVFTDIVTNSIAASVTGDITDLTVQDLSFNADGSTITNAGATSWSLGGVETTISDGTWAFDNTVDVEFDKRPTTLTSGMAMQAENYFEIYAGRNISFANPSTLLDLYVSSDAAAITPGDYFFSVNEDVQLRHFTVETIHLSASPAPWAIRLREGNAAATNDHASGIFTWGPTANTAYVHHGSLSGTQILRKGVPYRITTDADGGAGHNTSFVKCWLGVTVVSGLSTSVEA